MAEIIEGTDASEVANSVADIEFLGNSFLVQASDIGVVVHLTGKRDETNGARAGGLGSGAKHIPWGDRDDRPNQMNRLKAKNGQIKPLLDAKRDLIFGSGLAFFKRTIEDGKLVVTPYIDEKLQDWHERYRISQYVAHSINQLVSNGNTFTRFAFTLNGLPKLSVSDCFFTRIGSPVDGEIVNYCLNPGFGTPTVDDKETTVLPAFDYENPEANPVSILHGREPETGNPFYGFPSWWCTEDSIELQNLIPQYHISGIKNGYNIKYLIKMPKDYFDAEDLTPAQVKAKWAEFSDNLKNWLSGVENVNKSMLIRYLRGEDGKSMDSLDVVPMKNEMSDDGYLKVWEMTGVTITNGAGILPVLGGVTPGSKSGDSGSQIRVVADYQQHYRTPILRMIVLEPILYALRVMGYTDVVPMFQTVTLTTLDANPNGKEAVVDSAQ